MAKGGAGVNMKYRIMLSLLFDTEDEARRDFGKWLKKIKKKFPLDTSFVSLHKCYHDEPEPRPCEMIEEHRAE